ncbi:MULTISPECIES: hypothetical protein [Bacillus amyloliquefaciens group]|uniref:hypothetical protein n=1 Tax=Bacillus amyloliquefaciens group TaxID=1938374 RepID=UPI0005EAEBE9|nr:MULTISPECIES: hypothetical protein [Bacillus amyloliquefaciens group]APH46912.1 hypothetical protein BSF20_00105 [Bacillus amyloliquefaciens]APH50463.1 hypothetical protein BSF20_19425 [Bacillus amyloliquefaciens]KJR67833.1 hypothetical protein BAGR45_15265 [Bacillus velezensis]
MADDYVRMAEDIAGELRTLKRENERLKDAEEFIKRMSAISQRFINEYLGLDKQDREPANVKEFVAECVKTDAVITDRAGGPDRVWFKAMNDYYGIEDGERVVWLRKGEKFAIWKNPSTREYTIRLKDGSDLLVAVYNPFGCPLLGTELIVDENFEVCGCQSGGFYY